MNICRVVIRLQNQQEFTGVALKCLFSNITNYWQSLIFFYIGVLFFSLEIEQADRDTERVKLKDEGERGPCDTVPWEVNGMQGLGPNSEREGRKDNYFQGLGFSLQCNVVLSPFQNWLVQNRAG